MDNCQVKVNGEALHCTECDVPIQGDVLRLLFICPICRKTTTVREVKQYLSMDQILQARRLMEINY